MGTARKSKGHGRVLVGKANALTTITVRFVHEPKQAPDTERVDPSRVQVVGVTPREYLRQLGIELRKQYRRRGPSETMAEVGESIMAGFAEGVARANAIDVEPIGDSQCKQQFGLTVRK